MHFASPLFCALGYSEDQEAAGFGIRWPKGASPRESRRTWSTSPMNGADRKAATRWSSWNVSGDQGPPSGG